MPENQRFYTSVFIIFFYAFFLFSKMRLDSSANCSNVSASPRTLALKPISSNTSVVISFGICSSGALPRPLTRVFQRWLKEARIIWNISFSSSASTGASV